MVFSEAAKKIVQEGLDGIVAAGTWKAERIICSPMQSQIRVKETDEPVIVMCSNNYLGLSNRPELIKAASEMMEKRGFGMSSVRFICGTQDYHKELEGIISEFNQTEDTILYSSCFDANAGLFETILTKDDAVFSDALNHASVIDGVRLCKAQRYRFTHMDMADLEAKLKEADEKGVRMKMIATDGVFSMDGDVAPLEKIVELAKKYDAMVMVDDSHATGFVGKRGRGSPEHCGVMGEIDVITSTLGKGMGGASGGYTTGRKEIIAMLRQRSRPYLFSNSLAPAIVGASIQVFKMLSATTELRDKLEMLAKHFRRRMTEAGFKLRPGDQAIIPIMLGDAKLACDFAEDMLKRGIYVIGFSFPVVPRGEARIRVQLSASLSIAEVDKAVDAFIEVGKARKIIE